MRRTVHLLQDLPPSMILMFLFVQGFVDLFDQPGGPCPEPQDPPDPPYKFGFPPRLPPAPPPAGENKSGGSIA